MTDNPEIVIQKADPSQYEALTQIARISKKHWGYPDEWIDLWKEDLTITHDYIENHEVYIITENSSIVGFCSISRDPENPEVLHCWILPDCMGKGFGQKLLTHALQDNLKPATKTFTVISDTNDLGFYQKFGFKTIEFVDSSPGNRKLPLMVVEKENLNMQ